MSMSAIILSLGGLLAIIPVVSAHMRGRVKLIVLGCIAAVTLLLVGAGFAMARFMQTDFAQQSDWQEQEATTTLPVGE